MARPDGRRAVGAGRGGGSVTIDEVAAAARVSVATVSRALRDLPNVAPGTRARVRAAADELGYRADPHASRLAQGRTMTVGVAVPAIGTWYFSQVLAGVEATLARAGYDLLVVVVQDDDERHRFIEHEVLRKRVDGLLLVELRLRADEAAQIVSTHTSLVSVGEHHPGFGSIAVDNRAAARLATSHLLHLGHRRIGLLGEDTGTRLPFPVPAHRREGFHEALAAADVEADPALDVPGGFTVDGGTAAMQRLLALDHPPTAVVAMSDEMAFGALRAAWDHGLAVPGDLSVVGIDDHDVAGAMGLTTVRQEPARLGERAARLLLDAIADPAGPEAAEVVPTRLVVRTSTGRPPER